VRRYLADGDMPPVQAVRVEEMINYFDYHYAIPAKRSVPFEPTVAVYRSPWNPDTQILHIGIKGFEMAHSERPQSQSGVPHRQFALDERAGQAAAAQAILPPLGRAIAPRRSVSIVTYGGASGLVLPPTSGAEKGKILAAMNGLNARGTTAGAEGIRLAYELAEESFDKSAVNRVILATDGHLNVGIADPLVLEDTIAAKRGSDVFFSVLGFGTGNANDLLMQKLAQAGGGVATYVDTINEAHKLFVDQIAGTLFTIAKDVKIQSSSIRRKSRNIA
jgi:Ca-activated chloride channel family protein